MKIAQSKNFKCVLFACLIFLFAQISIALPNTSVPLTGLLFAIALSAILQSPTHAFASSTLYVTLGVLGLPVFAQLKSFSDLHNTQGYVLVLPLSSVIISSINKKQNAPRFLPTYFACLAGSFFVISCGTLYLSYQIGLEEGLKRGFAPFLMLDALKMLVVTVLYLAIKKRAQ